MSYIGHQCTKCGHPDIWRLSQDGMGTRCDSVECGCMCKPGEPQVRPTFDTAGQPVDRVIKPGDKIGNLPTCGCGQCVALYEQVAA